jgi:saccharopine dehydrogenase (NADP+, L-glutamate forming)
MAKTVGLPLGIAAKLVLQEQLTCRGLRLPTTRESYEPVLKELAKEGIVFNETHS